MHIILFLPQANIIDSNKDCQHFPVILKVNLRMLYYVHTNYTCILLLMYIDLLLHIKIIILQQHNTLYIYITLNYIFCLSMHYWYISILTLCSCFIR